MVEVPGGNNQRKRHRTAGPSTPSVGDDSLGQRRYTEVVQVIVKYKSKTNHGMTLPGFCFHFFKIHHQRFYMHMHSDQHGTNQLGTTENPYVLLTGCTEIKINDPPIGTIRTHPNYQSEGPWRDWVMAKVPRNKQKPLDEIYNLPLGAMDTLLCQTICFLCIPFAQQTGETHQPESTDHTATHVLLRTTYVQSQTDLKKSSVLFNRWRKRFDMERIAKVVMVPVQNIIRLVGVVDENPEMIEERDAVPQFLHSSTERELLQEDNRNRENFSDIVWAVRGIKEWAVEFNKSATLKLKDRYKDQES